jgi:hypothetical protein
MIVIKQSIVIVNMKGGFCGLMGVFLPYPPAR